MKIPEWLSAGFTNTGRTSLPPPTGYSITNSCYTSYPRAKALLPHCCIVLGGPEFLGNNEAFLYKNKFVSGVFRGEGEEVFPQWLKVWNHSKETWKAITGLCYLDENGRYQDNGIARVMNFSQLVSPEKSCFFNWSKPFVQLETTRGCFNTCAFCVSGGEKPVRTIPLEAIRERLNDIHQHGIKNVRVLDRTFNYNNKRAQRITGLIPAISGHLFSSGDSSGSPFRRIKTGIIGLTQGVITFGGRHSKFKRVGSATKPPYRKVIRRIGRIKISLFTKEYGNAC